MKDTILARPNLKMILLAALLVAGLKDVITNGHSQASAARKPERAAGEPGAKDDVQGLLEYAWNHPSPTIYMQISDSYEKQGEFKKALLFHRKAEMFEQLEEAQD